jgi:hypothetical protein
MQQTLLALLGVIILGLYGYSYHDRSATDERTAIRREIENAALGVATDWSVRLQQFAFDERILDAGISYPVHPDTLRYTSPPDSLGRADDPDETNRCTWDDVDDFHGFSTQESYPVGAGRADFAVSIRVRYADLADLDRVLGADERTNLKVAHIMATYVEPVEEPGSWAFKNPITQEVNVALSSPVLTVRQQMRGDAANAVVLPGC